jgi:glycosyltransferase involved in cell wall biosynthesis
MRRARPRVVHTHSWGTLCEGYVASRLAGVPVLIHGEHGTLETRRLNRLVQRWVWRRVNQVLAVSSLLARRMAATIGFPVDRIRIIRNGVDLERFGGIDRSEARRLLGLDPAALLVGTVGRLVPVKDHATLLHAVAHLASRGLCCDVVIAGEGPLRNATAALAGQLGLGSRVQLLGHRPDVERVLAALDLFVLPSRSEGLSNTILEAMASRLPVVATRVGGAEELVDDGATGLLVPPAEPAALADALGRLLAAPARRQAMGAAARRRTEREFGLDGMIRAYQDLYMALGRHDPSRG